MFLSALVAGGASFLILRQLRLPPAPLGARSSRVHWREIAGLISGERALRNYYQPWHTGWDPCLA